MVMSGGFGSSPYVRKCIKARYGPGLGTNKPNAQDMNIVLVAEPYVFCKIHGGSQRLTRLTDSLLSSKALSWIGSKPSVVEVSFSTRDVAVSATA